MIGSSPAFSVSEFVAVLNQSLDMLYPEVIITGELANFRISKNRWVYFDLKDEAASVKFFGSTRSLPGPLEDGVLLEVIGRPYLHPQFGFSIQVTSVNAIGAGSLNKVFLLLQKKLESEGLFDPERKRSLPFAPQNIGLITSKEAAAYGDFMKIIKTRWPATKVKLFNVQVQGRDAPGQIIAAIEKANQTPALEVLVLIRGGGSRDDLASFDHEGVVRAIAASRLPTLAAIGHERDVTLSELVADKRASTPSNAAEIIVPDSQAEQEWLRSVQNYLQSVLLGYGSQVRREIAEYGQQLDNTLLGLLGEAKQSWTMAKTLLQAYDPKQPLRRGYVLATDNQGKSLRTMAAAKKVDSFSLQFIDGTLGVKARYK